MAKPRETTHAQFLSAAMFWMALDAGMIYASMDSDFAKQFDSLVKTAKPILAGALEDCLNGLEWLRPHLERMNQAGLLDNLQNASVNLFVKRFSLFRSQVFPRLRDVVLQEIFSQPTIQAARIMVGVSDDVENNPQVALQTLAGVRLSIVGRPPKTRSWVKDVAALVMTPTEQAFNDAVDTISEAQTIGEQIRQAELDPDVGEASLKKEGLLQQLDALAAKVPDPEVVISTAAKAAAPKPEHPATKTPIAARLKLSPAQENAMLDEGLVIIAAGAGAGKCIRGDSIIQTEKGFVEIQSLCDLNPDQDLPLSMLVHGKDGPEQTSHIYRNGVGPTRKIETRNGYFLEGTPNHRILVLRNQEISWAYLKDLQKGDFVVIDRRPGMFAKTPYSRMKIDEKDHLPLELTSEVATLLGYIISEGYVRKSTFEISFGSSDPEQMLLLKKSLEDLNIEYTQFVDSRQITPNRKPWTCLSFFKVSEIKALMGFGVEQKSAHEKEVPFGILASPKVVVRSFLRSLFDGDGCVEEGSISYCTSSEKLARQLQVLLLSFGVISRKKFRPNEKKGAYHLHISGLAARTFVQEIGFNIPSKAQKANILCSKEPNTNVDTVPGIGLLCRKVKQSYKTKTGTTHSTHPSYVVFKDYTRSKRSPSFEKLQEFLQIYNSGCSDWESLKDIADSKWFFDPIYHIEDSEADTFDFVVPGTHSFSGNGFINHNTRVVAAEIVDIIDRRGVPSWKVIATSFSRKSAAELRERVISYGGKAILDDGDAGFGTTHSVSKKILSENTPRFSSRPIMGGDQEGSRPSGPTPNYVVSMAMKQVQMVLEELIEAPDPIGFFDGLPNSFGKQDIAVPGAEVRQEEDEYTKKYHQILGIIKRNAEYALREYIDPRTGGPPGWASSTIDEVRRLSRMDPKRLSSEDIARFMSISGLDGKGRKTTRESILKTKGLKDFRILPQGKTAADQRSSFWDHPANQWFNLGIKDLLDEKGLPIGEKKALTRISFYKGNLMTPSQVWHKAPPEEKVFAAIYGAYEWLKTNDPLLGSPIDMDDMLVETAKLLVGSKQVREKLQARYEYIIVDEAQDLSPVQHLLFGLIAGWVDPETQSPYPDGRSSAKAFVLIGDDKQCVSVDTPISTPSGTTLASALREGDQVLSWRNGKIEAQTVNHVVPSSWDHGIQIKTSSGKSLLMSPNHKIWASGSSPIRDGIQVFAHSPYGTLILGDPEYRIKGCFNYREALKEASRLADSLGLPVYEGLSVSPQRTEDHLQLMTASGLLKGMKVACRSGTEVMLEEIIEISEKAGEFVDLDVDDASNFFGGGILSHNSIYEFRGASPDKFIEKSDLVGGGRFKTHLLSTNYRSGARIVEAANKLIAHNERQIPMVCDANAEKNGNGIINTVSVETHEDGAHYTAEKIASLIDEYGLIGSDGKPTFGVAVRTNDEVMAFAMELLRRKIPFRCKRNLFEGSAKSLLLWAELASKPPNSRINDIVLSAYKTPRSGLGPAFVERLQKTVSRMNPRPNNYLEVLEEGVTLYSPGSGMNEKVEDYVTNLINVSQFSGTTFELLNFIINMPSASGSFLEGLVQDLKEDPEALDRLFEGETPDDEQIKAEAIGPLSIFFEMAKDPLFSDISAFMSYIKELQGLAQTTQKKDDPKAHDAMDPAVIIDTVHGWKGLECHHLFVPMTQGVFPSKQAIEAEMAGDDTKMTSERRLAYVALTRGQEHVEILCSRTDRAGRPAYPSQFVDEACIQPMGVDTHSMDLEVDQPIKTAELDYDDYDDDLLAEMLEEEGWDF